MTKKDRKTILALARNAGIAMQRPAPKMHDTIPAAMAYWPSWVTNVKRGRR